MTADEVTTRFLDLAAPPLGRSRAEEIAAPVSRLDRLDDISRPTRLPVPGAQP